MRVLAVSQVYPPDPAAVGQYVADAAAELVQRGHEVVVLTADRGYDNNSTRFSPREYRQGVRVRRLPFSSLGKETLFRRVSGGISFMLQVCCRGLLAPRPDVILCTTAPPLIGAIAATVGRLRRVPVVEWTMDVNPDQVFELGKLRPDSVVGRFLSHIHSYALRHFRQVIVLDRYMEDRLQCKVKPFLPTIVIPPWPLWELREPIPTTQPNCFRERHGLQGAFVVMYSGNHSPSNPLTTLLGAARALRHDERIVFVFVGGGVGKPEVERYRAEHGLSNVLSLPYQPLEDLPFSLAAADLHVVTMGDPMVGIIHPSKIYGAMAAGRPIIFIGPSRSHVVDILDRDDIGWRCSHGDVDGVVRAIRSAAEMDRATREGMGAQAAAAVRERFDPKLLRTQFCDALEEAARR